MIKVEMIVDWLPKADRFYEEELKIRNVSRAHSLLQEIQSHLEIDGCFKVVYAEVTETNHESES